MVLEKFGKNDWGEIIRVDTYGKSFLAQNLETVRTSVTSRKSRGATISRKPRVNKMLT